MHISTGRAECSHSLHARRTSTTHTKAAIGNRCYNAISQEEPYSEEMVDHLTKTQRSEQMARVRSKGTEPELLVRSLLHRAGFRFRLHVQIPGRPDIVLARYRTVVFVNGCFWHGHTCRRGRLPKTNRDFWTEKISRNKERDLRSITELKVLGWDVWVVWECNLNEETEDLINCLAQKRLRLIENARQHCLND